MLPPSSWRRACLKLFTKNKIEESQHPLQDASFSYGLSHGLKIARQLSIFAPVCALVSPFRVPLVAKNKREQKLSLIFWYTGRDSNPQPSEPESDALSIEPPVHLPNSQVIIASFFRFVKRGFHKKSRRKTTAFDALFNSWCLLRVGLRFACVDIGH